MLVVLTVILHQPHPTQPSPIEGEGSTWQRWSDLRKKIVIAIERHRAGGLLKKVGTLAIAFE